MFKINKIFKISIIVSAFTLCICVLLSVIYLYILPVVLTSDVFVDFLQKNIKKELGADIVIEKPVLKTMPNLDIDFVVKKIALSKSGENAFDVNNLHANISLRTFIKHKLILNTFGADNVSIDVNSIQNIIKPTQDKKAPSHFSLDMFSSDLYVKDALITYKSDNNVNIKLITKDLQITKQRNPKFVHFDIQTIVNYDNQEFKLFFRDYNRIYFKNKKLNIDNFEFVFNRSKVNINGIVNENGKYNIVVKANNFDIKNVKNTLDSNLIIPNGKDVLLCFDKLAGTFDFNLILNNKGIGGNLNLHKIVANLIPMANMPFVINKGIVKFDSKNIKIDDVEGYYGSQQANKIQLYGDVKNYTKTANTTIYLLGMARNDLAKYVTKLTGCKFSLVGDSNVALMITSDVSGKVSVGGGFKIPKGSDILVENSSISPAGYDRAIGIRLNMLKNDLDIEHINYYISDYIASSGKPTSKSLVSVSSKINLLDGSVKELAFNIPEPLPSEFFNVLVNQNVFRSGTFSGNLKYINTNPSKPCIKGTMALKDVRVVGQSLFIKKANLKTDKNTICITSEGRYRRADYNIDSDIENKLLFPIIVKNIDLHFVELDIERLIQSFAPRKELTPAQLAELRAKYQQALAQQAKSDVPLKYFEVQEKTKTTIDDEDEKIVFVPNLVAIKKCNLIVDKGHYKLINFANLHAVLTLTEQGILEITSNQFNFAEGLSNLKVLCDMAKENYRIKLEAQDVDADVIATSTLNLSKEISGRASAIMEFYTDKNAKLNGSINFLIANGSIAKLGFVQYILNMASVFRNPLTMISPSTLIDIVNIPDGTFKMISGNLSINNNIVDRMMIRSSSPQLSSFIVGQINLINFDSSLRIYTKFSGKNSGIWGVLRQLSINSIAKHASLTNAEVNYYASELSMLPRLDTGEENAQVFLTKVDGDLQTANFLSSLKKIK